MKNQNNKTSKNKSDEKYNIINIYDENKQEFKDIIKGYIKNRYFTNSALTSKKNDVELRK